MINLTEKEFKQLDLEFRTKASRLCRAKYQEVKMLLSKFLYYIEHTTVLYEYIQGCEPNMSDEELKQMIADVVGGGAWDDMTFDFGNDTREEIARQYRVLKYANDCDGPDRIFGIGRAFDAGNHIQSSVDGFIHGVVSPFVDNITLYLHSIAMNVCSTSEKSITINASGSNAQINVSQGNSTLTASHNVFADWNSFADELRKLRVADEDIAELKEILSQERPVSRDNLGPRVDKWIAKIVVKAANGMVNLSVATAANVLSTLICKCLGWN